MRAKLKPIAEQVIVVTGASSGLGLETARAAALAGAAVVMAAADEAALRRACEAVNAAGGRAHPVVSDPTTAEGADRIARAGAARFGRFDSWIDASGDPRSLVHAAEAAVRHFRSRNGGGALVGFGGSLAKGVRAELKRGGGAISTTMIRLPPNWRPDAPAEGTVAAALYAAARPAGRLDVAPGGRRLTLGSEAQKHRGLLIGLGLVALAAAATWLLREELAAQARPRLRRVVRPLVLDAARRRPIQAARLVARHPRQAIKLALALR